MKFLNSIDGASKIITDSDNRFVTDVEKQKWDNIDNKVDKSQVLTNVPANAVFTDTKYTHPTTHPYSMITGTPTSLPANGGHALSATHLLGDDTRAVNSAPSVYMNGGSRFVARAGWQTEFKYKTAIDSPPLSGTYVYLQTHTPWSDPSGGYPIQIAYGNGIPCWRVGVSTTAWSAWQKVSDGGNANTVNGFTVGVNVPANAKFTDTNTITTINGKTGAIAKADIVALGIPSQDTIYTHPTAHPYSMITGAPTSLPANGGNANTVNGFTVGVNVPSNAKFTDTVTTINGKTGAISKADIVALGVPSSKSATWGELKGV